MNDKILIPSTIVPSALYVDRDADRQIAKVLSHMGRPGYVLVARQMGKTNLLINAKRKYENDNDVFVYIDLSNIYKTSRECFRSFVDTAIDTHSSAFSRIKDVIYAERRSSSLEPHQEHHRELKNLLKTVTGKLVFILDEVDALTKTNYSDEIFAQVRSIYFSRINFKESERLTYLLSGVAEPSELIKDKNISPFNIGQKIYLDDFNYDEFRTFIANTNVLFPAEVIDRVFYWCNGNPRITWDVCSEIEDLIIDNLSVTVSDVDAIINKLYLKAFDRPPVDHIRSIVEKDKDVRNAITEIRYNKSSSISDSVKSKLYLSGIIGSYNSDNDIVIKNKIIDMSLSEKYIDELEAKVKSALIIAYEKYFASEYEEAIDYFNKFLSEDQVLDSTTQADVYYKMGNSSYLIDQIEDAKKYLQKSAYHSRKKLTDVYYDANYLLGLCEYYTGNNTNAIELYNIVLNAKHYDITYFKSLLAVSSSVQTENGISESIKLLQQLLQELDIEYTKDNEFDFNDIKLTAYHNLGYMYIEANQLDAAEIAFNNGISIAPDKYKPKLHLGKIRASTNNVAKTVLLQAVIELLPKLSFSMESKTKRRTLDTDFETFYGLIVAAMEVERLDIYDKFINELRSRSEVKHSSINTSLLSLANFAFRLNDTKIASYFLAKILHNYDGSEWTDYEVYHSAAKLLYTNETNQPASDLSAGNISLAETVYSQQVLNENTKLNFDIYDLIISSQLAFKWLDNSDKETSVRRFIEIADIVVGDLGESYRINYSWIFFLKMLLENKAGKIEKSLEFAKKVIDFNKLCDKDELSKSVFRANDIKNITDYAARHIQNSKIRAMKVSSIKYGRNQVVSVKYGDGKIITTKYKKVSDDISKGKCELLTQAVE